MRNMVCKEQYNSQKNMIYSLDVLRFIMAIFVTMLHLKPLTSYSSELSFFMTNWLTRIADSVFFCITSYLFFYTKELHNLQWKDLFKYVKRIFVYYTAWTIIYMPLIISNFMTDKYDGMSLLKKLIIFVRRFLLIGSWTPLWFMPAAIIGVTITFIFLKFNQSRYIILSVAIITYVGISCFSSAWIFVGERIVGENRAIGIISNIYAMIFGATTVGNIPYAFCFIALGMCVAYNKHFYKIYIDIIGFIVTMLMLFGEVVYTRRGGGRRVWSYVVFDSCNLFLHKHFFENKIEGKKYI